jgi:hypothetical protein
MYYINSNQPFRRVYVGKKKNCQAENRFLGFLKGVQIWALYNNPIPAQFLAPFYGSKVPAPCWYF